jgi:hypothetical protein
VHDHRTLCVAIPTIPRNQSIAVLTRLFASLVESLEAHAQHKDPFKVKFVIVKGGIVEEHPELDGLKWLPFDFVENPKHKASWFNAENVDYAVTLKECSTRAEFVVMLEDDVLVSRRFFDVVRDIVDELERFRFLFVCLFVFFWHILNFNCFLSKVTFHQAAHSSNTTGAV